MELIHLDYLTVKSAKSDKDINILVVLDNFNRYMQAFVTLLQTAQLLSKLSGTNSLFIIKILSEQGCNF